MVPARKKKKEAAEMTWQQPWRRYFSLRWWKLSFSRERRQRHGESARKRADVCFKKVTGQDPTTTQERTNPIWVECYARGWYTELYEEYQEGPSRWGADEVK